LSFVDQSGNSRVLGRIVVHDRVQVEAKVLPRYFNHSSFASLRRQLNYFSFVRLGKGRQRESTYVNENVVVLDDILHLKRRPSTVHSCSINGVASSSLHLYGSRTGDPPVLELSSSFSVSTSDRCPKRRRQAAESMPTTVSPRSTSPVYSHQIPEADDDSFRESFIVLDLTKPEYKPDADVLAGCKSLMFLSSKRW
jgi:HSF-type DNA-binding